MTNVFHANNANRFVFHEQLANQGTNAGGGGGGDMQVLHMGVLTKFFSPLEKRGSLGGFLHISNLPAEKRDSF